MRFWMLAAGVTLAIGAAAPAALAQGDVIADRRAEFRNLGQTMEAFTQAVQQRGDTRALAPRVDQMIAFMQSLPNRVPTASLTPPQPQGTNPGQTRALAAIDGDRAGFATRATNMVALEGDDVEHPAKRQRLGPAGQSEAEQTLGKWAIGASTRYQRASWREFIQAERGEPHLTKSVGSIQHRARRLLHHLRDRGARSVPMTTAPWTRQRILAAAKQGSHKSANDYVDFVCQEMVEFAQQGFWTILPLAIAITIPHLRLSPLGVVPQRNRRPRLIVDYHHPAPPTLAPGGSASTQSTAAANCRLHVLGGQPGNVQDGASRSHAIWQSITESPADPSER